MKIDANFGPGSLDEIGEWASKAEDMGFAGIWASEAFRTPFIPCAIAASHTTNIDIGTVIAVAFPRSPAVTAYTAWDLQRYSKGRSILGLGTQVKDHTEGRFGMKWESPGPKMREYVRALRSIWKCWQEGDDIDFKGDFYSFDLMPPFFSPDPLDNPDIPVYISAVNEYNLKTAGEFCEEYL